MIRTNIYNTHENFDAAKKTTDKKYRDKVRREIIEQGKIPAPVMTIEKYPEKNLNKGSRP